MLVDSRFHLPLKTGHLLGLTSVLRSWHREQIKAQRTNSIAKRIVSGIQAYQTVQWYYLLLTLYCCHWSAPLLQSALQLPQYISKKKASWKETCSVSLVEDWRYT